MSDEQTPLLAACAIGRIAELEAALAAKDARIDALKKAGDFLAADCVAKDSTIFELRAESFAAEASLRAVHEAIGEHPGSDDASLAEVIRQMIAERDARIQELEGELTESYAAAASAMRDLNLLTESAKELAELLREKFQAPPEMDALNLYTASLLSAFAGAWNQKPPENGYIHCLTFPGIGKLELTLRKIDGKSAAESLNEVTQRAEAAEASLASLRAELAAEKQARAEDTELLDWLGKLVIEDQYHFDIAIQSDAEDGLWVTRIWRYESGGLHGVALDGDAAKTEDIRSALRAARAWEAKEQKHE